ncbi:flagellar biosynthesis anti-sigma factor FlgM [Paenibacillus soyae]|uniref:Negative regulator of flagellin synthesis n=1 Tax=Paenibacillus soyae TaxID=2969249 RepID=A0A9X2MTW8_9BACL|nr:flagellar biosynthesis anti-sigma factor FlgM [Paenibacillus soyae]MCR2806739.1 flagellar biosynthesis anti-sigma factor FlgM [Paenibacillus soyae]
MKINETKRVGATNPYAKQNEPRADNTKKAKQKDEVQISAAAMEMLSTSKLNETERSARINELKQAVSSGTYHVDAGKIAEKLLPFIRE